MWRVTSASQARISSAGPNRNYAVDLDGGHSLFPGAAANSSILLQLGPGDVLYAIRGGASDAVLSVLRAS
jgi:hypothetical protein